VTDDELLAAVRQFLTADGWPHTDDADGIDAAFQGEHGRWKCRAVAAGEQVRFFSIAPVDGSARVAEVRELVARINWDLPIGNFEVDADGRTIRCKTAIDVGGDRITPSLLRHVVWGNVSLMDRYLPAITAVVDGSMTPSEAVAAAEA
jgi:hypothetical protein